MTQAFGKYQLLRKLATGGMAEVWLARQIGIEGFNRDVVVKRILPHLAEEPEFVQMFLNEAKIAARFSHPNIGQIFDLGENEGQYFIAMEFIHGEDLGRVMRRAWSTGQWVARPVALRIISDACQALHYAHGRLDDQGRPLRVVHRDISPQNILVSFDGGVKLVDFGIAKAADQVSNTKSGAIKGKFAYMAPEQAAGKALDSRTDIFAMSLVLYELLTGVRPLKRDAELATLQAALECDIQPPSVVADVPEELDDVVMRGLQKDIESRYRDARQMHMAIEEYLVREGVIATSVQVSQLMEALFADRLAEEARTGRMQPATQSSSSYPASAEDLGDLPSPGGPLSQTHRPQLVAPEGAQVPSRRYAESKVGKPEETRAGTESVEELPAVPERRGTASVSAIAPKAAKLGSEYDESQASASALRRGSRKSLSAAPVVRRGSASVEAPPPRRSRQAAPVPEAEPLEPRRQSPPADLDDEARRYADVTGLRNRQQRRTKAVAFIVVALGALILAVVFREPLGRALNSSVANRGLAVKLTVNTNPRTQVTVVPPAGSKDREPLELGNTPITEAVGVFRGDTVVLANQDQKLRYETVIEEGRPGEVVLIERTFREATLKVAIKPKIPDVQVFREGQPVGSIGVPIKLMEGIHHLELRSPRFLETVLFDVQLGPGQVAQPTVDVESALLRK
jgi:eukaryotic-like serine/threonine-protein kinase